jgi:hypothetical protein
MPKAFRCSRTGVLFPADYIEEWGKKYGHGLGSIPVSEALTNDYRCKTVPGRPGSREMHVLAVSRAQVDLVDVTDEEYQARAAVIALTDPRMEERAKIMIDNQLIKSKRMQALYPGDVQAALRRKADREGSFSPSPEVRALLEVEASSRMAAAAAAVASTETAKSKRL